MVKRELSLRAKLSNDQFMFHKYVYGLDSSRGKSKIVDSSSQNEFSL